MSDQPDRLSRLREIMRTEGIDLVALAPGAHMASGRAAARGRTPLYRADFAGPGNFLMPALEADSAREQTDMAFYNWADADGPDAALGRLLDDFGADRSALVLDECMRADHAALITDALPAAARHFTAATIGALRMRKEDGEYRTLKTNATQADTAMKAAWAAMRPGVTELEVAQVARDTFSGMGARPLFSIVGAGRNGAFPHHHTGQSKLQAGDAVVVDIGAGFEGYSSDITRMVLLGDGPEGYAEIHDIVNRAVEAAMAAARPGVKAHVVDDAARHVIAEAGYGEYFVTAPVTVWERKCTNHPTSPAALRPCSTRAWCFPSSRGSICPTAWLRLEEIVILRADGPKSSLICQGTRSD